MVARTILTKRQDAAMERIQAHAERKNASGDQAVEEAIERLKNVRGPDEQHTRVFRIEAIADLLDAVEEAEGRDTPDPLEAKRVPELRQIATDKGVENPSELKKAELIEAIRQQDESEDEDGEGE